MWLCEWWHLQPHRLWLPVHLSAGIQRHSMSNQHQWSVTLSMTHSRFTHSMTSAAAHSVCCVLCVCVMNAECASNPCRNGATCVDLVYVLQLFSAPAPTLHLSALILSLFCALSNGHTCTCAPGYQGILCQTDINECASSVIADAPLLLFGLCSRSEFYLTFALHSLL